MRKNIISLIIYIIPMIAIAQSKPEFIVKPYLQYATKSGIRILWETNRPCTSKIAFGEAVVDAKSPQLTQEASLRGDRIMHEVELTGLKAETNYFWRAVSVSQSGEELISDVYTFKTAVEDSTAYMFALVGDPQQNSRTPWAWDSISRQVWQARPNFVIAAGDLVDWGHHKKEWLEEFLAPGHQLMSRMPLYSVPGNHEGDADYYYQYMANPQPEYRYTFEYGNALFFMVDTNRDISEGSDQYNWLEQQLAKSSATWKIVVHHHPPYSSESDDHGETFAGGASTLGHIQTRDLPALYDKYGVDFSLFGHTHVYERTWPLKNNRINQREGTIYINSGGAGGGLETFAPTRNWFTLELQEGHHYCTFTIYDKSLIFKALDEKGRVFDRFQINKEIDRDEVVVTDPPAPIISSEKYVFHQQTKVEIASGLNHLTIRYTLDGTTPNSRSTLYSGPIMIDSDVVIKARAYTDKGRASRVNSKTFTKMIPLKSQKLNKSTEKGLNYKLYAGNWEDCKNTYMSVDNQVTEGVLPTLDIAHLNPEGEYWGISVEGYFQVKATDTYTFYGYGSRGITIAIDGNKVIERPHEQQEVIQLVLERGWHRLEIQSFQRSWRKAFGFGYWDELKGRHPISPFDLKH